MAKKDVVDGWTKDELAKLLTIDLTKLHEELKRLPKMSWDFGEMHAQLKKELAYAEADLKLVESELQMEVRRNPSKFNLEDSPKEASYKAAVLSSNRYQKALDLTIQKQYEVDTMSAFLSSVADFRRGLVNEVELLAINYHSEPRITEPAQQAVRDQSQRSAIPPIKQRARGRKRDDDRD